MDKKELGKLATASPTAMGILKALVNRQREPREGRLELRRVTQDARKMGVPVIKPDFMELFRGLEKLGLGKVVQLKGKEPSFQWAQDVSMQDTCRIALEEASVPDSVAPGNHEPNVNTVHVMLAPGRRATYSIPADLTHTEADFLNKLILSQIRR